MAPTADRRGEGHDPLQAADENQWIVGASPSAFRNDLVTAVEPGLVRGGLT